MLTPRNKKILTQVGSFLLAGGLLYLALRGVDFDEVGNALRTANYYWLLPLAFVTLLSHWMRAWRWQVMLEELPSAQGRRLSVLKAFYSIMIGYMANYAAPRLGEVVRSANTSTQEKLRFGGVFGSVVIERILDVLVLGLAMASVAVLFFDRFEIIDRLFIAPLRGWLFGLPAWLLTAVAVGLTGTGYLLYRLLVRYRDSEGGRGKIRETIASFKEGFRTLFRTRRRGVLVVSTVVMWFCYLMMAYIPIVLFGLHTAYGLTLVDAWGIMIVGAIGVVIPSPGGTGSYHYVTIQTMVHVFGVATEAAASYAILTHAGQLILYVIVGGLALVAQGTRLGTLTRAADKADNPAAEDPAPAEKTPSPTPVSNTAADPVSEINT